MLCAEGKRHTAELAAMPCLLSAHHIQVHYSILQHREMQHNMSRSTSNMNDTGKDSTGGLHVAVMLSQACML